MQEARQPHRAQLSDRWQPSWERDGAGESAGFHTAAVIPT